jgi:hypothetical protein
MQIHLNPIVTTALSFFILIFLRYFMHTKWMCRLEGIFLVILKGNYQLKTLKFPLNCHEKNASDFFVLSVIHIMWKQSCLERVNKNVFKISGNCFSSDLRLIKYRAPQPCTTSFVWCPHVSWRQYNFLFHVLASNQNLINSNWKKTAQFPISDTPTEQIKLYLRI